MRFEQPLLEGTWLRRSTTFVAEVLLESGEEITAHCANPASLSGCVEPGSKVLISVHDNPRSKFRHHLEIVYAGRTPVAVHTGRPASVLAEAISQGRVPEIAGYATLRRDAGTRARNTRIDLVAEGNGLRSCYVKLETVTMAQGTVAMFPDTQLPTGPVSMSDMTNLVREGNRALLVLLAQRVDVESFKLHENMDPAFTQALRDAAARGVEVLCYRSKVTKRGIELDVRLPVDLGDA